MIWYRFVTPNFVACVIINKENIIVETAPILKRWRNRSIYDLTMYAKSNGWTYEII
jgi:hypothetical protein